MKYIIAGSRSLTSYKMVKEVLDSFNDITEIVSGNAKGPDRLGERYARNMKIPVTIFKPNWKKYGKAAGPKRNIKMGDYADRAIVFWDGTSKGTKQMIDYARSIGMVVHIYKRK